MNGCIAVINAGSSSIKFATYDAGGEETLLFRGQIERIGVAPRLTVADAMGEHIAGQEWPADGFDHRVATRELVGTIVELIQGRPVT
ncbi:MAG: hypothetical protein ACREEG_12630, partial [Phenylobacterium sp.]